jgi:cytidylate kinase
MSHTSLLQESATKLAERQMRQWVLNSDVQRRIAQERAKTIPPNEVHPYVAVSRECGAGGGEIARQIGQRLGWTLLDRELLQTMAESCHSREDDIEFVDEKTWNWLYELTVKSVNKQAVTQTEYVVRLGPILLMAARNSSTVIVGRGAQYLLPRWLGLSVRIIAPREQRIDRMMRLLDLDRSQATRHIPVTSRRPTRGAVISSSGISTTTCMTPTCMTVSSTCSP